jgi:hypothetical protein
MIRPMAARFVMVAEGQANVIVNGAYMYDMWCPGCIWA